MLIYNISGLTHSYAELSDLFVDIVFAIRKRSAVRWELDRL